MRWTTNDEQGLSQLLSGLVGVVTRKRDETEKRKTQVQDLALTDPVFADRLKTAIEKDPKALENLYKKHGIEDFIKVQPESAASVAEKAKASENNRVRGLQARDYVSSNPNSIGNAGIDIQELSKLNITPQQLMKPLDNDEKSTLEEFRAKESGTKTKKERELTQSGIDSNNQQLDYYKTELGKSKREEEDKALNTKTATGAVARIFKDGEKNLYKAVKSGKLDAGEKAAVFATPKFKAQYDAEFEEYWKEQQQNEQKDYHNKSMQEMKAQSEDLLARKTVDETDNQISYDTALKVIRNPQLMSELADKKLDDIPNKTPEITQLWKAAQFYKDKAATRGKAALAKGQLAFQSSATYKKFFGDKKKEDWSDSDLKELNDAAGLAYMSEGILDAPQYELKKEKHFFGDKQKPVLVDPSKKKKEGGANTKPATPTAGAQSDSLPNDFDYAAASKEVANVSDDELKKSLKAAYPELKDGQIIQMLTKIRGSAKK